VDASSVGLGDKVGEVFGGAGGPAKPTGKFKVTINLDTSNNPHIYTIFPTE
jgi:hypothetical protein